MKFNELGVQIIKNVLSNLTESIDWNYLRNENYGGFADFYLDQKFNSVIFESEADLIVFQKLVEIDLKLGTQVIEELSGCLSYAMRIDLIKVFYEYFIIILPQNIYVLDRYKFYLKQFKSSI